MTDVLSFDSRYSRRFGTSTVATLAKSVGRWNLFNLKTTGSCSQFPRRLRNGGDDRSWKPHLKFLWIWTLLAFVNPRTVQATALLDEQSPATSDVGSDLASDSPNATILNVEFGLAGFWKLGHPTQTLVTIAVGRGLMKSEPEALADNGSKVIDPRSAELVSDSGSGEIAFSSGQPRRVVHGRLEIESVDADGVGVIYQIECQIEQETTQVIAIITQHGRAARPMRVRFLDASGQRVVERLISNDERGTVLPVGQPWIVGIGSGMDLEQAALRSAKGSLPSYSTCEIVDLSQIPSIAKGYQGIDLLVISTRDWKLLESLSLEQQEAILEWVRSGGHALIWLGENAERVRELPWLVKLIRAEVLGVAKNVDPMMLESFLSSQKRLGKLACSRLVPDDQCLVDLALQSLDRQKLPLIYRTVLGFGQVQVCATDLDSSPIREWSERKLLLERLYNEQVSAFRDTNSRALDQSSYLGYTDLSGQIHAALDLFEDVRIGSLSLMAIILLGIVALLGPLDYLVFSKAWRKPAWTWISLFLWSISTMVGITLLARAWKPRELAVNSIELVDIDYSTSSMRGRGFAHHYSGQAGRFDFSAIARSILPRSEVDSDARSDTQLPDDPNLEMRAELSWSGQPGYGLGGFDSDVRTDIGFPTYRVLNDLPPDPSVNRDVLNGSRADLIDVGITFAGSKSIRADWSRPLELMSDDAKFSVAGTSEFLQGSWTNPMDRDLLDGWLLYRSWLYPLKSRIRPNGAAQIAVSDIPKDLGRRLQRRQFVQDRDSSIPWDPTDRKDVGRLVEMLTLYQAGGGSGYTGLSHSYWNELDLSKHLKMNRVIIFGRLADPVVEWLAKADAKPLDIRNGKRVAYVRFVIPVTVANGLSRR